SAMPLMWAHAEYIRLLRSRADGAVFDRIPAVADRYTGAARRKAAPLEVWKRHRPVARVAAGTRIRIQLEDAFFLHFSRDGWATVEEQRSAPTGLGFEYLDITPARGQKAPLQFTFRFASGPRDGQWEGRDYQIAVD
ncbi:MAG: glycoside hydrolase family 15 protein, partial [Terriglobales bacterium]